MSELATILSKLSPAELEVTLKEADELRTSWPKHVNLSLHRDKDSNFDVAADLGLSLEAQDVFAFAGYELTLTTAVYEDGSAYVVAIKSGEERVELSTRLRI